MMGVWQKLVLFLVYAQLLNGVLGHNVWLDILGRWGKLNKDAPMDDTYKQLNKYLILDQKRRDPMVRTICHGMRDVTDTIKQSLDIWKEFPALKLNTATEKYYTVPTFQFKPVMPAIDLAYPPTEPDPFHADHFFEVQFSAPLILHALDRCKSDGNCKMEEPFEELFEAMRILKGILNHKSNMVWIRSSVNTLKANYLAGHKITASPNAAILFAYLHEMAPKFRDHIARVKGVIQEAEKKERTDMIGENENPKVTILSKLLDILEKTPFVTGQWADITYIKRSRVDNGVDIMIRKGRDDSYDRPLDKDELIKHFLPEKYEESAIIGLQDLMNKKGDGRLDDPTYDVVLDALVRDSIAKYGGDQCQVLSDLDKVQNRQVTDKATSILSQLVLGCYQTLWNELESIDREISQMDPEMDLTHAKARWKNVLSIAEELYEHAEDSDMTRNVKNFLIIVSIELDVRHDFDLISQIPLMFTNLVNTPHENWVMTIGNTIGFIPEGFKTLMANLERPINAWFEIATITELVQENLGAANLRYEELIESLEFTPLPTDIDSRLKTLGRDIGKALQRREYQNEYGRNFRDEL